MFSVLLGSMNILDMQFQILIDPKNKLFSLYMTTIKNVPAFQTILVNEMTQVNLPPMREKN